MVFVIGVVKIFAFHKLGHEFLVLKGLKVVVWVLQKEPFVLIQVKGMLFRIFVVPDVEIVRIVFAGRWWVNYFLFSLRVLTGIWRWFVLAGHMCLMLIMILHYSVKPAVSMSTIIITAWSSSTTLHVLTLMFTYLWDWSWLFVLTLFLRWPWIYWNFLLLWTLYRNLFWSWRTLAPSHIFWWYQCLFGRWIGCRFLIRYYFFAHIFQLLHHFLRSLIKLCILLIFLLILEGKYHLVPTWFVFIEQNLVFFFVSNLLDLF